MTMTFDTVHNFLWQIVYALPFYGPPILLLLLVPFRRKFRFWRWLVDIKSYPATYIGETTWFPTYRKRNSVMMVTTRHLEMDCYTEPTISTGKTVEYGWRARGLQAEMKRDFAARKADLESFARQAARGELQAEFATRRAELEAEFAARAAASDAPSEAALESPPSPPRVDS